mmetsp:Transcript_26981/g.40841  ORF Transcript_26981/g.40841 Transcript_26981/m.40841 type:complete len:143 (-) Transcript_26981:479-907(-)
MSSRRTYVGVTNNLDRRLRQHNGQIVGGAKATGVGRPWKCLLTVEGFPTKQSSLQFEWMWKHVGPKKSHGLSARLDKLQGVLQKDRWTQQAPLASSIPLLVNIRMQEEEIAMKVYKALHKDDGLPPYVNIKQREVDKDDEDG